MLYIKNFIKKVLIFLSVRVLKKHKPYIIAIMGSVGKTSARNAVYTALSKKYSVRKSEQSLTTDIGVPLTLLGCPYSISSIQGVLGNIYIACKQSFFSRVYPQYVILEIDGHTKGEIGRLVEWLSIDLLIITAIGEVPAHVEYFETPDVLRAEYALIHKILKQDSKVVYYADDEYSQILAGTTHASISYGAVDTADISATDYTVMYEQNFPVGISFSLKKPAHTDMFIIKGTLGVHAVNASLCAMAVLQALGEHPLSIKNLLDKMPVLPGRMKILSGLKNSIIIDDTYNSSPIAVEEFLTVLRKINAKRKIVVIGDMLELGRFSSYIHREFGKECVDFDLLICVGFRSQFIRAGAVEAGMVPEKVIHFDIPQKAGVYIQNILQVGDIVAVKGSQNMRMERCVEEIMAEPEKKEKLLVRQNGEWLGR